MKFLIVGLGNIGSEYDDTRHNIGFDIVDNFALKYKTDFSAQRLASIATCKLKAHQIILCKPSTFMNLSGKAVKYWMDAEKVAIENVLIVVDDLSFPIEVQKLKNKGSSGGHNGLQNIEEILGTQNYHRLRFGIGNNFPRGRQVEFVLGKWSMEEATIINKKIMDSISIIESFVSIGAERTMNLYNTKN